MIALGVHAMPEATMEISHQLTRTGRLLQRFALKHGAIPRNQVKECRLDHKKSSVDPPLVQLRLFLKTRDAPAIQFQFSKTGSGTNGRYGDHLAVTAMKGQQGIQIDIGYAISVGQH